MVATRRCVSIDLTSRSATKVMFRSANAASNAREVSGDGGTGVSSGRRNVISQALRRPRVVRQSHSVERRAPEHHIELGETEREGIAFVDQGHVNVIAERLREHGAELKPAEARAENEDAFFHGIAEWRGICF